MNARSSAKRSDKRRRRPRVLCVDDESDVLCGLERHLRKHFTVHTESDARAALARVESEGPFAIVLSDMRMPEMSGAVFLAEVRKRAPDSVRMLLTGHADTDDAIAAVNQGGIYRFLTKPCPPQALLASFEEARRQYELVVAERQLLEETLQGSVELLSDVLALTHPEHFGRAARLEKRVAELCGRLGMEHSWQVEVATLFSQLDLVSLPPEVASKVVNGGTLTAPEQTMVATAREATQQMVGRIPRLEAVQAVLAQRQRPYAATKQAGARADLASLGGQVLRVVIDYDQLERQGETPQLALDSMRGRGDDYDPEVLEAFAAQCGSAERDTHVQELPVSALRAGMVLLEDLRTRGGAVFAARGYEITKRFVARARNFQRGYIHEPFRVSVPMAAEERASTPAARAAGSSAA